MKSILSTLLAVLIVAVSVCAYAGTVDSAAAWTDQKIFKTGIQGQYIIQVVWHADAAGAFTETTLNHSVNGYILKAKSIPSPFTDANLTAICTAKSWTEYSPTNLYDVDLDDIHDMDLFGGALDNLLAATIEDNRPIMNAIAGAIESYSPVTLEITGNTAANAVGAIQFWIERDFTVK